MGTLLRIAWINLRRDRVAQALTFILPIIFFSIFATVFGGQGDAATHQPRGSGLPWSTRITPMSVRG